MEMSKMCSARQACWVLSKLVCQMCSPTAKQQPPVHVLASSVLVTDTRSSSCLPHQSKASVTLQILRAGLTCQIAESWLQRLGVVSCLLVKASQGWKYDVEGSESSATKLAKVCSAAGWEKRRVCVRSNPREAGSPRRRSRQTSPRTPRLRGCAECSTPSAAGRWP